MDIEIKIILESEIDSDYEFTIPYAKNLSDSVLIQNNTIRLQGKRNKALKTNNFNAIYRSSIYLQIMKLLLFAYISCNKIVKIQMIQFNQGENPFTLESEQFAILNNNNTDICSLLDIEKYKETLKTLDKSEAYIKAMFYYIEAQCNISPHMKFEKFWKSFNILYVYHSKQKEDFKGLVNFRKYIKKNPSNYLNTIGLVNNLQEHDLRNNFRWRNMILNDYETENKTNSYKDFVLRYKDFRVMKLMKEVSCYRDDFLRSRNLYNTVHDHIDQSIRDQYTDDTDLICLLIVKYSYFLRNKYFHGEYNESFYNLFKFGKNDDEFYEINKVFESFLGETLNFFDTL